MNINSEKKLKFKICPTCGTEWNSREEFLSDPDIDLVGYQVHFDELTAGLFLFNHSCKTTMSILAATFVSLYNGPIFSERATSTDSCEELCLRDDELGPCHAECECAYVREILQIIKKWPKRKLLNN